MKVIGIDPGSKITGFAVLEKVDNNIEFINSGIIDLSNYTNIQDKLKELYEIFLKLIDLHVPTSIAIEDIFYAKNIKSTIKLGYIKGTIFLAATHRDIKVFEYTPTNVKSAITGSGRASKDSVRKMLKNLILHTPTKFNFIDESDAISIAYCHLITQSFNMRIK